MILSTFLQLCPSSQQFFFAIGEPAKILLHHVEFRPYKNIQISYERFHTKNLLVLSGQHSPFPAEWLFDIFDSPELFFGLVTFWLPNYFSFVSQNIFHPSSPLVLASSRLLVFLEQPKTYLGHKSNSFMIQSNILVVIVPLPEQV